jgi:hypothetical protein
VTEDTREGASEGASERGKGRGVGGSWSARTCQIRANARLCPCGPFGSTRIQLASA